MFRALNALVGFLLFLVGGVGQIVTWFVAGPANWDPNGYAVLAAVGVVMLGADLWVEHNQAVRHE